MMELDELKQMWAEYDRKLDLNIQLNYRLLSAPKVKKAGSAIRRFAIFTGLDAAVTLGVVMVLGCFIYDQRAMMRFVLPGAALDAGAILILSLLIRQLVAALEIDYEQPIAVVQRRLEALRMMRIRYIQNVCLYATLAWIPLLIVALRLIWGVDAYRVFGAQWLTVNAALGAAIIPIGIWVSRRFGARMNRYPIVQRFMNDLAGYSLNKSAAVLAGIAEFENSITR